MNVNKRFTVTMPYSVHKWLKNRAIASSRSMSGEVLEIVKNEKRKEVKTKEKN
jgi:hypothetical protein